MHRTSVVVIGAGQAGLAVSHLLSAAGGIRTTVAN